MWFLGLLAALLGLGIVASPFALVYVLRRLLRVEQRLAATEARLAQFAGPPPVAAPAEDEVRPAEPARPATEHATEHAPERATPRTRHHAPAGTRAAPPRRSWRGLEEAVTARLIVWVGGIALMLAAVFLFSFAIEQGWLGPWTRVGMGLGLGAALVAAGNWADRHRPATLARAVPPDAAGPALTAAGVFALYVSLYAAHALYALIGPAVTFAALGLVSFAALALARRHGWFVALVGLAGGYLIPALLGSGEARAAPVFLFLFALSGACLALLTVRRWWLLALAVLVGALGWPLLWLSMRALPADQGVIGAYAVGLAALFGILGVDLPVRRRADLPGIAWLLEFVTRTSGIGFLSSGMLLVLLALLYGFNPPAVIFLGLYAGLGLLLGLRQAAFEGLPVAAALVVAVAVLIWPQPAAVTPPEALVRLGVERAMSGFGPFLLPPELQGFARALLGFAALFGLGAFAALRRAPTPGLWAGLSAAMPLFLLAVAYWRIGGFEVELGWFALAAGLALANLAAAAAIPRLLPPQARAEPIGFYAAASTAALALAFACVLREGWLTVAVALQIPALAWIWSRLRVPALRAIALGLVVVVIVRLVLNPAVVDYQGSVTRLFGWVIYAYGLPALAMLAAARLWRQATRDPLADLCEIAATAFLFLMVALQLRLWTSSELAAPSYDLFAMAVQTTWWLLAAALLLRRSLVGRLPWARAAGTGLLGLAVLQLALGHLLLENPLATTTQVGSLPLVNLLALAYLAPALLLGLIAGSRALALDDRLRPPLLGFAGLLAFAWVTLEVRRAFWDGVLRLRPGTMPLVAESYAYSAVWIAFALALLAVGILRRRRFWRAFALAVLTAATLKVFLLDMSDLTGLYRVASFLGLGLALIAIGQVYRRFVFAGGPPAPPPAPRAQGT